MKHFKKYIFIITILMVFATLTACSTANNVDEAQGTQSVDNLEAETGDIPSTSADNDFENYIEHINNISNFEPYYNIVFAFENLPGNISSLPIEKVNDMYFEMKDTFDYILIGEQPLAYRGDYNQSVYKGETSFVDGYEQYKDAEVSMRIPNPINAVGVDWEGNEIISTSLKTVMLGESIITRFDNNIEEGRNLQISDFTLKSSDEPISVVLGNEYKEFYEIGDTFSLELISEVMNFEVVGFYKPGISFLMDVGAKHKVSFDYAIIMPHLMFDYEPIGEASVYQHAFLTGEKMSGYIGIEESISEINEDTFVRYTGILEKMAEKNGVSNLYKVPYMPVGFIW